MRHTVTFFALGLGTCLARMFVPKLAQNGFYSPFMILGQFLDFAFVPEFLAATSLLEPAEVCRTELKPLMKDAA